MREVHEYEAMSRAELIEEMNRLRRQEADILIEVNRMKALALAPINAELSIVKDYLNLKMWPVATNASERQDADERFRRARTAAVAPYEAMLKSSVKLS